MAIYTRGVAVSVVEDGVEVPLTAQRLAADVVEEVGGVEMITGPQGPAGETGPAGEPGAQGQAGSAGAAGEGIPTGGTNGQLLAKNGTTAYAARWITVPSDGEGSIAALRTLGYGTGQAAPGGRALGFGLAGENRPDFARVVWIAPANRAPDADPGDIWIRTS